MMIDTMMDGLSEMICIVEVKKQVLISPQQ